MTRPRALAKGRDGQQGPAPAVACLQDAHRKINPKGEAPAS